MKNFLFAAGATLALGLCGCASDPGLGDSVRAMVEGQKYDPSAPHGEAGGFDGQKAVQAVEASRAPRQPTVKAPMPTILIPGNP